MARLIYAVEVLERDTKTDKDIVVFTSVYPDVPVTEEIKYLFENHYPVTGWNRGVLELAIDAMPDEVDRRAQQTKLWMLLNMCYTKHFYRVVLTNWKYD